MYGVNFFVCIRASFDEAACVESIACSEPSNKVDKLTLMPSVDDIIVRDSDILGGTPVFRGTRVPFQALVDYLEGGG